MLSLITKDLLFNKKQVLIGLLLTIAGLLPILDGPKYAPIGLFMVPALLFSQIVGKNCYMEDKDNVYKFLKSLPIPKRDIVISKYVECMLTLAFSYIFLYLANSALTSFSLSRCSFNLDLIVYMASTLLIYFSVFLWIFFKYNIASAQQSMFFILIGALAFFKLQDYLKNASIKIPFNLTSVGTPYLLLSLAFMVFIVLSKLAINDFVAKE